MELTPKQRQELARLEQRNLTAYEAGMLSAWLRSVRDVQDRRWLESVLAGGVS